MSVESAPQRGPLTADESIERRKSTGDAEKARLAWLHVHALDDVREQRIEFDRAINVVLGKNGVGKTTLLNLISMVLRWDFRAWSHREFDVEARFESGDSYWALRVKNVRDRSPDRSAGGGYLAEVRIDVRHAGFAMTGVSDRTGYRRTINGDERVFESIGLDAMVLLRLRGMDPWIYTVWQLWRAIGAHHETTRFDEGLDAFRSIVGAISTNQPLEFVGMVSGQWQAEFPLNTFVWEWIDPQALLANPDAPVLVGHERLGISQAFLDALGAVDVVANFGVPEVQRSGESTKVSLSSFELRMKRANGDVLRHTSWSWGQQRLVAFALYLAANKDYVVADELVNGMHHEWIELCLREIGDRQCFLTSQNPILVDYTNLVSVQQIQRAFVLCAVRETKPGQTARTWRNMTENEAAELWEARTNGFESTSEVMRNRGWW